MKRKGTSSRLRALTLFLMLFKILFAKEVLSKK